MLNSTADSTDCSISLILDQTLLIDPEHSGQRLDQALAKLLQDYSRSQIQDWIKDEFVQVNQVSARPKDRVYLGDRITLRVPQQTRLFDSPESVEFDVIYQDDDLIVVNKPAGLVVHPAAGHQSGTLLNGLLHLEPRLEQLPRAGIVHRLDKDTSGVMVVARSLRAHTSLVEALQARAVSREYQAVAQGLITAGSRISQPIARHPVDRKRMAVRADGKEAITHFRVNEKFRAHTLLDVQLETGRTHQIRVHMAWMKHALLGDPVYAGRSSLPKGSSEAVQKTIRCFIRQALHARKLKLVHPASQQAMQFEAPMPEDMRSLIETLRVDCVDASRKN